MKRKTVVVGLNVGHDGGAAIIIDGIVRFAISEERLNRTRYSPGYLNSFFYCLEAVGMCVDDISLIVFSSYGKNLPAQYSGALKTLNLPSQKFNVVDHHLSHAYGAYFLSPFDDALIVILDGEGNNNNTESYYVGDGQKIKRIGGNLSTRNPAKGIGRTFEAFTNFIGWSDQDAGKTMGLAAYKDSSIATPLFHLKNNHIGSVLEYKHEKGVIDFEKRYAIDLGSPYGRGETFDSQITASYVQEMTERNVVELIRNLVLQTGKRNLCLAGGVALNCSVNRKIEEAGLVDDIFVLPASSDRGQALGNALFGYQSLSGHIPKQTLKNDYFGRSYSEKEILIALNRERDGFVKKHVPRREIIYKKQSSITKTVAKLLAEQKIGGWFQGGSELGPRALGHRSILCDPRNAVMKKILNDQIKHREGFRPFSPSCLWEYVSEYFDCDKPSPYMLFTVPVKKKMRTKIPAVVHVDGSARLQTVHKNKNDRFYDLLSDFYDLTGMPVLLNTSFNDREPIVETPGDALSTFLSTNLDFIAIEDYLVLKR